MTRTEVGYAGGRTQNPTYHDIADHAECVDVRFDPDKISYASLLDLFWAGHDPTEGPRSTQYRAALFCHSEVQRAEAEASAAALGDRLGRAVQTEILVEQPFYPAEGYHQKWRLRRHRALFDELSALYPNEAALLRSTAAAKANGFVGGQGDPEVLAALIDKLGLSAKGKQRLLGSRRT